MLRALIDLRAYFIQLCYNILRFLRNCCSVWSVFESFYFSLIFCHLWQAKIFIPTLRLLSSKHILTTLIAIHTYLVQLENVVFVCVFAVENVIMKRFSHAFGPISYVGCLVMNVLTKGVISGCMGLSILHCLDWGYRTVTFVTILPNWVSGFSLISHNILPRFISQNAQNSISAGTVTQFRFHMRG